MAKRLTEKQKKEIIQSFKLGKTIEELSGDYKCTKLTIIRNLKKNIGEKNFQEIFNHNKSNNGTHIEGDKQINNNLENDFLPMTPFLEITPLNYEIDDSSQKDFASIPIDNINFPKLVFMIVDKKIELETKFLKDYPSYQFLSKDDLNRKTIEIYFDLKKAKRFCNKEQKIIKVPNTEVFKIVAPLLLSRGISRIVCEDKLIALWIIYNFLLIKSNDKNEPAIDPVIKLTPITKLIGSFTVSVAIKLTFFFIELFCIPTIKRKKKQELIVNVKNNFFNEKNIYILN